MQSYMISFLFPNNDIKIFRKYSKIYKIEGEIDIFPPQFGNFM